MMQAFRNSAKIAGAIFVLYPLLDLKRLKVGVRE